MNLSGRNAARRSHRFTQIDSCGSDDDEIMDLDLPVPSNGSQGSQMDLRSSRPSRSLTYSDDKDNLTMNDSRKHQKKSNGLLHRSDGDTMGDTYNHDSTYDYDNDIEQWDDSPSENTKKNKWTKEEFIEQLSENERNTPSIFPSISKYAFLGLCFVFFAGAAIYVQTSLGGFEFHGFASNDDDDDDDNFVETTLDADDGLANNDNGQTKGGTAGRPPNNDSDSAKDSLLQNSSKTSSLYTFDADAVLHQHDAFHVSDTNWYGGIFTPPSMPYHLLHSHENIDSNNADKYGGESNENGENIIPRDQVGYIQNPNIFNHTLVFCSEGDVYITTLPGTSENREQYEGQALPAMRLTSTVGNVNSPTINPQHPFLIAFTATYTGHREVYLMDLRSNYRSNPSMRLTYMDSRNGVLSIIGWENDGTTLVVSSHNVAVAMEDVRLYKIGIVHKILKNGDKDDDDENEMRRRTYSSASPITVSSIQPVPLSQAIDSTVDDNSNCRFFTRFKQSSNTVRYVGGTAEHLWAYCDGKEVAIPLTKDYIGTSKSPRLYTTSSALNNKQYLFFLSDRASSNVNGNGTEWTASTMNLWAVPMPHKHRMYSAEKAKMARPFRLTSISCQFSGMHLQEYAIDPISGSVVLRVGADLHILTAAEIEDAISNGGGKIKPSSLPIAVYSDFNNLHERIIPLQNPFDVSTIDVFDTGYSIISTLMTARGQLFVNPVIKDLGSVNSFGGGGMNMPARRYRVAPGSITGGMTRIYGAWYIPGMENGTSQRMTLVLATDPLSPTAENAFYIMDASAGCAVEFADVDNLPLPLVGGHTRGGGSVKEGGLGSVDKASVTVSPCGRRVAWTDTEGNIRIMDISQLSFPVQSGNDIPKIFEMPQVNENGEPVSGIGADLTWSPSGRYVAIVHSARNKFHIISIADLGDPALTETISSVRLVQATPDRFNSMNPFWGRAPVDFEVAQFLTKRSDPPVATILYYLTDRDVVLDRNTSPWGTRAPNPQFEKNVVVYALPLLSKIDKMEVDPGEEIYAGSYVGGGASELMLGHFDSWTSSFQGGAQDDNTTESMANITGNATDDDETSASIPSRKVTPDIQISFGKDDDNLSFARRAYLVSEIPASNYRFIHQLKDDPSIIVAEWAKDAGMTIIKVFAIGSFPDNVMSTLSVETSTLMIESLGVSTSRNYLHFTYSGKTKVIANSLSDFTSIFVNDMIAFDKNIVDTDRWAVSVWPKFEYQQMYADAWRMLRDFYYDRNMGNVDWSAIHDRYLPLVARCGRREELDDVLRQMSAELSALHVFVYGGEYNDPLFGNSLLRSLTDLASLGAVLERSAEWSGYIVKEIPELDPDLNPIDGVMVYGPLSDKTLRLSGQRGLEPGDVIVGVNGESTMNVPDINMLLRGMAGRSIRLDVLRINSESSFSLSKKQQRSLSDEASIESEPVIVVPISTRAAENLRYSAWEWKTRQLAKSLAKQHGFSVGYLHLRSMSGAEGEDSFVRGFYPDYNKDALVVDVRHNSGGNIDSWLLDSLQRKAWMYWQSRAKNITMGGLGWDEHYAFRGHIVVLIDEKTSSDGESFSRGMSELGLGKLVGTRTWGGGIWLSSDNRLIDGGIASAPEMGTYNEKFGWGLGIEQMGVDPDVEVDNNPRTTFNGGDEQMRRAIEVLRDWLEEEPVVLPADPGSHRDMSLQGEECDAA